MSKSYEKHKAYSTARTPLVAFEETTEFVTNKLYRTEMRIHTFEAHITARTPLNAFVRNALSLISPVIDFSNQNMKHLKEPI